MAAKPSLVDLITPATTAIITQECQKGVIGDLSPLPDLATAAKPTIPRIVELVHRAREVGAAVIHCTGERRADGRGANTNARIFGYMARTPLPLTIGTTAAAVLDELNVNESDFLLARLHGLSPFQGTELDSILRNLGIRTVVVVGVSVNVAIQNLTFDAVNSGYEVVLPRDAVAGWPDDYVDAVFANTLNAVATVTTTEQLLEAWTEMGEN